MNKDGQKQITASKLKEETLKIMRTESQETLTRRIIKRRLEKVLGLVENALDIETRLPGIIEDCAEIISNETKEAESSEDEKAIPASKKQKTTPASSSVPDFLSLGGDKRVTVNRFRNNLYVDIREYYKGEDGEAKPGKKGISLSRDQFNLLRSNLDTIMDMLKKAE